MPTIDARAGSPVAVMPEGGEELRFIGASRMWITYDPGPDGDLAFYEYSSEPGVAGSPQHIHGGHDETFYVVQGTYEFTIGEDVLELPAGSFLRVPRGTPHAFRNSGSSEGRIVGTFNPARFAGYFRELAAVIETTGAPPSPDEWAALYGRYDTTFYNPSTTQAR